MSSGGERVLVRLDGPDAEATIRTAQELSGRVGGWVVGMDLLLDCGPILVGALCTLGKPVLVDLSLLARPMVVARAVARMGKLGARWGERVGFGRLCGRGGGGRRRGRLSGHRGDGLGFLGGVAPRRPVEGSGDQGHSWPAGVSTHQTGRPLRGRWDHLSGPGVGGSGARFGKNRTPLQNGGSSRPSIHMGEHGRDGRHPCRRRSLGHYP